MKKYLIFITCLWFSSAFAQNAKINSYFQTLGDRFNGNILLAQNGRVVLNRAAGYADFLTKKPNTTDARFNLCSISKVFTSTAILQLRDKGKLSLDDHLAKYFPDFQFKDITLRQLLAHTSGLPDFAIWEDRIDKDPNVILTTDRDLLPAIHNWKGGLRFEPGTQYQYCNVGYQLLALVIEKVSGTSLSNYLERYIFKPSGMKDTYLSVYPSRVWQDDPRAVKMHRHNHPYYDSTYAYTDSSNIFDYVRYQNYNCGSLIGGSNVISTTTDLMAFDRAFFSGKLLKSSSVAEVLEPLKINGVVVYDQQMDTMLGEGKMTVGLGWSIWEQPGYGKSVGHGGYLFGNATIYIHHMQGNQTIIAFDNADGSGGFGQVVTSSLYLLNGKEPMQFDRHHSMAFVYGSTLVKDGADAAACALNAIKGDTAHYYLNEWEFNQLGGNMLNFSKFEGHQQLALEVFKLNTIMFPNSANTYDSYAFGLRATGKKKEAIQMYQKSLAMDPNNDDGKQALKELMEGK
jgi:CubicO group peptidase (beta-lactamase class C family)